MERVTREWETERWVAVELFLRFRDVPCDDAGEQ
jgi:hypothetical protein